MHATPGAVLLLWSGCALLACRAAQPAPVPDGMVVIPGGTFVMGCDPARDDQCAPTEQPAHQETVAPSLLDRTEVTQADYARCVAAGACVRPAVGFDPEVRPNHPVAHVNWEMARAFCAWRNARLPREQQWERAARGQDQRRFPWGDAPADCQHAHLAQCGNGTSAVGQRPLGASPYGVLDLAGNVDEWMEDAYAAYGAAPPASGKTVQRVARGGAYDAWHSRTTARNALDPTHTDALLGLRCARDVTP